MGARRTIRRNCQLNTKRYVGRPGSGGDMSAFEFFFGFYSLILGLAVVEVVSGFSKVLRSGGKVGLGYCTPLIALFILLDLVQFWNDTWFSYQNVEVNPAVLTVALGIASIYYLAASLLFPDRADEWGDMDAYYDRHKRQVIGASIVANVSAGFVLPVIAGLEEAVQQSYSFDFLIFVAVWLAPLIGAMLIKSRRISAALLGLVCTAYLVLTFYDPLKAAVAAYF